MESLSIDLFEWPLPGNSSYANAAVVEISVPHVVRIWRNVTWELVTEVFRKKIKRHKGSRKSLYFTGEHSGLRRFLRANRRLQPASTVKPMEVAHYRSKHTAPGSTVALSHNKLRLSTVLFICGPLWPRVVCRSCMFVNRSSNRNHIGGLPNRRPFQPSGMRSSTWGVYRTVGLRMIKVCYRMVGSGRWTKIKGGFIITIAMPTRQVGTAQTLKRTRTRVGWNSHRR
jgi:hypothetical protein